MELIKNLKQDENGLDGEVYFSLFQKYITLSGDGDASYAHRCAAYLNELGAAVIDHLCEASIRYCNEFLDVIGEPTRTFATPRDVLALISSGTLIVPEVDEGADPVVHLAFECDWEEEHGMEWIIRADRVLYVGSFSDEDPFGDFSHKDEWNYA